MLRRDHGPGRRVLCAHRLLAWPSALEGDPPIPPRQGLAGRQLVCGGRLGKQRAVSVRHRPLARVRLARRQVNGGVAPPQLPVRRPGPRRLPPESAAVGHGSIAHTWIGHAAAAAFVRSGDIRSADIRPGSEASARILRASCSSLLSPNPPIPTYSPRPAHV